MTRVALYARIRARTKKKVPSPTSSAIASSGRPRGRTITARYTISDQRRHHRPPGYQQMLTDASQTL